MNPSDHILELVQGGWHEAALRALSLGKSLCERDNHGRTILHYAVLRAGHGETTSSLVSALLARGCDPNVRDRDGYSPLGYACLGSSLAAGARVSLIEPLIDAGGNIALGFPLERELRTWEDIAAADDWRISPSTREWASKRSAASVEAGQRSPDQIEHPDSQKVILERELDAALATGHIPGIKASMEKVGQPSVRQIVDALRVALRLESSEFCKWVLYRTGASNRTVLAAFELFSIWQHPQFIEAICLWGFDVRTSNESGCGVFHWFGAYGPKFPATHNFEEYERANRSIEVLRFFGGDVNQRSRTGETALHFTFENERWGSTEILIDNGADPNIRSRGEYGCTALALCITEPDIAMLRRMLSRAQCDLNVQNAWGKTPALHFAALNATSLEVISVLLEFGVEIDLLDRKGETALCYLARRSLVDGASAMSIATLLLERGADRSVPIGLIEPRPLLDVIRSGEIHADPAFIRLLES